MRPNETALLRFELRGIYRAGSPIAAHKNGDVSLVPGQVVGADGELWLRSPVRYVLEEPFPKILLLGGRLLVESLPLLKNQARRCLLLSETDGSRELWLYFEPEKVWGVAAVSAGSPAAG